MPARATAAEVKEIVTTSLSDGVVTSLIETATEIVDGLDESTDLSDARLVLIELWLAAHFVAVANPQAIEQGVSGGISEKYESALLKAGMGLLSTRFGQQAVALDTSGTLAAMTTEATVGRRLFKVI